MIKIHKEKLYQTYTIDFGNREMFTKLLAKDPAIYKFDPKYLTELMSH